jgi:GAF domain-containing protein
MSLADGSRAFLGAPLLREGESIGAITLRRAEAQPFTDKQIALLQTFADQAVIAIQNVKLFVEVQARTRDLQESLQHQTATADVLKVISRSAFDLDAVMNTLTQSAAHLCKGEISALYLREGDKLVARGAADVDGKRLDYLRQTPIPINSSGHLGRAVQTGTIANIADVANDADPGLKRFGEALGFQSILFVPLMREGQSIGVFGLGRRITGAFSLRQIELVQTFADQAVIAIENVRLFDEVQAKTRDLEQALTYQTASANILKVIASTPTDVEPALKAIVDSACELCEAYDAAVVLRDGDDLRFSAHHGPIPIGLEKWPINRRWTAGRAFIDQQPVHIEDLRDEIHIDLSDGRELAIRMGHRTILSVPLIRDGESIGAIVLRRQEVHPFTDRQIGLLQTFADQAVIAIANVRLFEQVQAKTRDLEESLQFQTASSDVLKVISQSPDTLQPVLDVIVDTSRRLCSSLSSVIFLVRGGRLHVAAYALGESGQVSPAIEYMRANPVTLDQRGSSMARAAREKRTVHIADTAHDPEFNQGGPLGVGEQRALLSVPLIRDGGVIGGITLRQSQSAPFTPRQIELIETFADQAVIAISNVNLFEQVQQRTRELSKSLEDLRAAQDRLVQTEKLASLGQLTAGIAHEIKNPLNFVNNFSALSSELVDELLDVLKPAELGGNVKQEVDELTHMLKGNLEKVVQHGKRADSIVKNMLLHSRAGSGEHRPTEINSIVEESLNLAYHGARAETAGFNITLKRDLDPDAGLVDVYPQEMTRVLLNLISNGFYAAAKRKAAAGNGFEPILSASTRNLGDTVEIRVRDNGTGIPLEVKEKMFNPFFTTKPAGEGTGLGLSMSHDIVVKQHQGTIEVETEPGAFTEFIITLPRAAAALAG